MMNMKQFNYIKTRKLTVFSIVFLILFLWFGFGYDTGNYVILPGEVVGFGEFIEHSAVDEELYILTYYQYKASPFFYIYSKMNPKVDLLPKESVVGHDMNVRDFYDVNNRILIDSQMKAKYVAFNFAGYAPEIKSEGVFVLDGLDSYSAYEILKQGDIISSIDGEEVFTNEDMREIIREKEIGSKVTMEVLRRNTSNYNARLEPITLEVPIGGTTTPQLGIWTINYNMEISSDINVKIKDSKMGGPSGGMMITLGIYNSIIDEDLTKGYKIAGTGQINLDGTVGGIYGMKQKVYAAEREGVQILFCPEQNYDEAIAAATKVNIVPVSNFSEVVEYLNSLNTGDF